MRDTRTSFLFFGLLLALNALGLFVYSIDLAKGGRGGSGVELAVVLLAILVHAVVAAGHAVDAGAGGQGAGLRVPAGAPALTAAGQRR